MSLEALEKPEVAEPPSMQEKPSGIPWWFWAFTLMAILLPRLCMLGLPPGRDQESVGVAAEMLLAGKIPYRDCIIMRGPLFLLMHAASLRVFGHNLHAVNVPDLFCWIGFAVVGMRFAWRLYGTRAAMFVGFGIATLASTPLFLGCYIRGEVDEWVGLGWLFTAYQLARIAQGASKPMWRLFWAGAGIGFTFLMKTNGLFGVAPAVFSLGILAASVSHETSRARGIRFFFQGLGAAIAGTLASLAPIIVYLWQTKGLYPAYETLFKLALAYSQTLTEGRFKRLYDAIFHMSDQIPLVGMAFLAAAFGAIGYDLFVNRSMRRVTLITASFLGMVILTNATQTTVGYRDLLLLPFIALFAARGFDLVLRQTRTSFTAPRPAVLVAWALAFLMVTAQGRQHLSILKHSARYTMGQLSQLDPWYYWFSSNRFLDWHWILGDTPMAMIVAGDHIKKYSAPTDTIQVWDSTGLVYFAADRLPATPHLWHQFLIYHSEATPSAPPKPGDPKKPVAPKTKAPNVDALDGRVGSKAKANFLLDMQKARPAFIVVRYGDMEPINPWQKENSYLLYMRVPGIKQFMKDNYELDKEIKIGIHPLYQIDGGGYLIYCRKDIMERRKQEDERKRKEEERKRKLQDGQNKQPDQPNQSDQKKPSLPQSLSEPTPESAPETPDETGEQPR